MKPIQLRAYQRKFINDVLKYFSRVGDRVCGVAPCGSGKTVMAAHIAKHFVDLNKKVIFMVHRHELVEQTARAFDDFALPFGIIESGSKTNYAAPVQIATVQTLARRLDFVYAPYLLICDECHHILAETYQKILKELKPSKLLGLTATPERYGGIRLGDCFQKIIEAPNVDELVQMGYLANIRMFSSPYVLNLEKVHVRNGDYDQEELSKIMQNVELVADLVETYNKKAAGTQAICYCVDIAHSKLVTKQLNEAGISALHIDHTFSDSARAGVIDDFRTGKIKILCNVNLFGEGLDLPKVQTVIMARPTKSLSLYIQQSTRGMRIDPESLNKESIILDHANNYERFDRPDYWHYWSVAPNKKEEKKKPLNFSKKCPCCGEIVPYNTKICPECDFEFQVEKTVTVVEGELVEVKAEHSGFAARVYELKETQKANGYKKGWLYYQVIISARSQEDLEIARDILGYKPKFPKVIWGIIEGLKNVLEESHDKGTFMQYAYSRRFNEDLARHFWQKWNGYE